MSRLGWISLVKALQDTYFWWCGEGNGKHLSLVLGAPTLWLLIGGPVLFGQIGGSRLFGQGQVHICLQVASLIPRRDDCQSIAHE